MSDRTVWRELGRRTAADIRQYWYYLPALYLVQVALLRFVSARPPQPLPVIGVTAAFLVLFTVIVGDPGRGRRHRNLLVTVKLVGYYGIVSMLIGLTDLGVTRFASSTGLSAAAFSGPLQSAAPPSLIGLITSRLSVDPVYWSTVTLFLLFFLGAYRLAKHGGLRAAIRESPTLFLKKPVEAGAVVMTGFMLVYVPMAATAMVLQPLMLRSVHLAGESMPVAALVLLAATSLGGLASMRFIAQADELIYGESEG